MKQNRKKLTHDTISVTNIIGSSENIMHKKEIYMKVYLSIYSITIIKIINIRIYNKNKKKIEFRNQKSTKTKTKKNADNFYFLFLFFSSYLIFFIIFCRPKILILFSFEKHQ